MPVSKKRTPPKRTTKRRDRAHEARARETQAAQEKAASVKKLSPRAYMRRRVLGWSLIALGILVLTTHLIEHLGFFSIASPGVEDLLAGYPMAAVLILAGVFTLSK